MESTAEHPASSAGKHDARAKPLDDLKSLPMVDLLAKLGLSVHGLSEAEVQKRLVTYGPNEIEERRPTRF